VRRITSGASIYLASTLQYITTEMLELAGDAASGTNMKEIVPGHIDYAIENDNELT